MVDGVAATEGAVADLLAFYEAAAEELPLLTTHSVVVMSQVSAVAAPIYAGLSIDIFFVHLDLQATLDLVSQSYGATLGLRLQFE